MEKRKVIIIGAGAAGLMAAKELSMHDEVIVLEASSRTGGRIHSEQAKHFSRVIEAGAEFIHGHLPLTLQLLMQGNIDYVAVEGEMYRHHNGAWTEQDEMIEGWDTILNKMKAMPEEMTLYEFLEQYYPGKKHAALRQHITNFAEGFDVADIKKASVRALYQEWSHQEQQSFRIPKGYGALINFLQQECEQQGCRILLNHPVSRVYWKKNEVSVYTEDGERFDAEKLIVAIPLTSLRNAKDESAIRFIPTIDNYIKAAEQVGIGAVLKVVLQFEKAFWKEDTGFILSDQVFPTWWTQLPDTSPILTGWIGGPRVEQFTNDSEEEILEKALQSLAAIYDIPMDALKKKLQVAAIFSWQRQGAYSYVTPQTEVARKLLNQPIMDTLFFAGEAIYEGESQGTVEAALASGKKTAEKCRI